MIRKFTRAQPATEAYEETEDHTGRFIAERCTKGQGRQPNPELRVEQELLYETYGRWCSDEGIRPATSRAFASRMQSPKNDAPNTVRRPPAGLVDLSRVGLSRVKVGKKWVELDGDLLPSPFTPKGERPQGRTGTPRPPSRTRCSWATRSGRSAAPGNRALLLRVAETARLRPPQPPVARRQGPADRVEWDWRERQEAKRYEAMLAVPARPSRR